MSFTNLVLGLPNNTWSGDHKAYQAAAIGAKGREMQSYHRDMMKVPDGKRVVSVFAALDEDLYSVDGTNTVFLPHSREGLPRPWDPIPIPLRRGDLFVLYSDLVHAGGGGVYTSFQAGVMVETSVVLGHCHYSRHLLVYGRSSRSVLGFGGKPRR